VHDGSDTTSISCFPTSTLEINKMIINTPAFNTNNLITFANSTLTFCVSRPIQRQLHGEEVLVIGGLRVGNATSLFLNAFLYIPTANTNTSINCRQFLGKLGNSGANFGPDLPDSKKEWRLAITPKLQSLGMDQYSHIVVTFVQLGVPQKIQFKTTQIVYFE
jgi:hypothetical protein